MHVTVSGKRIEVGVTDSGMFHDKPFMYQHAKTLKGLEKKLREADVVPPPAPIFVEHISTHRIGRVVGSGRARYSRSYRVKWNDNDKTTVVAEAYLHLPMTFEQRLHYKTLENAVGVTEDAYNNAQIAFENVETKFDVGNQLRTHFPQKR